MASSGTDTCPFASQVNRTAVRSSRLCYDVRMTGPARRADAAANRARIVAAARAEVAADGAVKLNAVARRAGVGQGTLYRHFPTRADLLAEVHRADVDDLVTAADQLLADHEPLTALRRWFDRAARSDGAITGAITRLRDAGRAAGAGRPDVDARDVVILIGYLSRLDPPEFRERARPLLEVVLDGLRARD